VLGGVRYYDILGFHLYGGYENFLKYSQYLNEGENKPVWITEWGLRLDKPFRKIDKFDHASKAMKALIKSISTGLKRFFWFYYSDVLNKNKKFGLVDSMNTPRPVLVAFNNIIHLLEGARFIGDISDSGKFVVYKFIKNDRTILVVWCNKKKCEVPIYKFGKNFVAYDVLGNEIEKNELIANENFINVNDRPIYLVMQ